MSPTSLNYSLEGLPKARMGGYDRQATAQLFARLSSGYRDVVIDRDRLRARVDELEARLAEQDGRDTQIAAEVEGLKHDFESSLERERSLNEQLERSKTLMDEEIERVRADVDHELARLRADLAAREKREALLAELIDAAKRSAETIKQEAREEASAALKKATRRRARIVSDGEHERIRLEAEKERLTDMAAKLRTDLSTTLIATLRQLESEGADSTLATEAQTDEASATGATPTGTRPRKPADHQEQDTVVEWLPSRTRRQDVVLNEETESSDDRPRADATAS